MVTMAIEGVLLDIDGTMCGRVWSAQGGDGIAPVVEEPYLEGQYLTGSKKHIQPPEWEDLELQFSLPLNRTVSTWIRDWWQRRVKPRTVRLTAYDSVMNVIRSCEFQGAIITDMTVSALSSLSSESVMLKLKIRPETVRIIPPSGTVRSAGMPQPWLARNFRLDLSGLDAKGIFRIDSFTV